MTEEVQDKIIDAQMEGLPILECSECGEMAFILEAEGIHDHTHYPIGECANCGGGVPKEN